ETVTTPRKSEPTRVATRPPLVPIATQPQSRSDLAAPAVAERPADAAVKEEGAGAAAKDHATAAKDTAAKDSAAKDTAAKDSAAKDAGTSVANADDEDDDTAARADDGSNENDRAPPPEPAAAPPPASSVRSINEVRSLIKKGNLDGALAGLYRLRRSRPTPSASKSSEIASLIGDVYFDRKWWTDGLREYRFAISLDGRARKSALLVDNSVHALADRSSYPRARRLILDYVGRSATPALKRAAKQPGSPTLRRRAQKLLAALESKSYRPKH